MSNRLWAALCLLSAPSIAHAQLADSLAATSIEHYPSAENGERAGQTRLEVFRASVGAPVKVTDRTTLLLGGAYEGISVHPSDSGAFQLHAPKLGLGIVQGFTERWGMIAMADVGFASDFSGSLGSADLLLALTAVGTFKVSESVKLGAGAVYDRRTGRLAPLPALLLDVRPVPRLRVRGFAPVWLNAEYHALDWLDVGVRSTFEGNRFHLVADTFGVPDIELAYSNLTVGPKVTFNFTDWLHLDTYAAYAVYRRYELFQNDESYARYDLSPVVGYGARFWIAPSGW
jgi:hypothetical protein